MHFNLPDLRHRFVYGADAPAEIGQVGGEATHLLLTSEMPAHNHNGATTGASTSMQHTHGEYAGGYFASTNPGLGYTGIQSGAGGQWANPTTGGIDRSLDHTHAISTAGGGAAHNNLPPYILIAQIIKITGTQIDPGGALVGPQGPPGSVAYSPLVTELPANPLDGDEVNFLVDAVDGIVWHLKYRLASASPYKWELVGGSELLKGPLGSLASTGTWPEILPGGPSITVSLPGDYHVFVQAQAQMMQGTAVNTHVGIFKNGTVTGQLGFYVANGVYSGAGIPMKQTLTGLAAGDVLTVAVGQAGAGYSTNWSLGILSIKPTRVG